MVNLTAHELRFIAEKRNIKDYKKMSTEELLRTFDESEHFLKIYHKMDPSELQKHRIFHKMK